MLKINRTTEYGLLALLYLSRKGKNEVRLPASAREISNHYDLPYEITAKTLQKLKESGWIASIHGAHGGYRLEKPLVEIKLGELIRHLEGDTQLVDCGSTETANLCEFQSRCDIQSYMNGLNRKWVEFLDQQSLSDLESSALAQTPTSISMFQSTLTPSEAHS